MALGSIAVAQIRPEPRKKDSMAYDVTFIPGDGTGPELAQATRRVLEATGVEFNWVRREAGIDEYEQHGNPFPDDTLASLKRTGVGIKGPTTTPVGSGFRSVNVLLRKELDLYACIRPCKAFEGVRTRFPETDLVIVRENTEDLYAGIEFERGTQSNAALRATLAELGSHVRDDAGISIKPISVFGSERIVRHAFDYAVTHGHRKVVAAHKANIMKFSDGLFLEVARNVAADYPAIDFDDIIIDNLCNQLITYPEDFEVIVLPNLYGDIVSDLCAAMIGGLGMAGGAARRAAGARVLAAPGPSPPHPREKPPNTP